ncbi:unnamed protein product [Cunninghamella echinulata]
MLPDTFNYQAGWFRQYFVGNPYITLIGPLNDTKPLYRDSEEWDNELFINTNNNNNNNAPYAIITVAQENNQAYNGKILQKQYNNNKDTITPHKKEKKTTASTANRKSIITSSESSLITHVHSSSSSTISDDLQDIHYRVIIRTIKETNCYLLPSSVVKDKLICLDTMGQSERLESCSKLNQHHQKQKRRPLRSISSAIINHATGSSSTINLSSKQQQQQLQYHHQLHDQRYPLIKLLHAAVLTIYSHLDLRSFKTLSAEDTILAGLEKELLHYDEIGIPKNYKFGVLCVKDDQTTEEEWFSNTGLSKELEYFLNIIGRQVTLKDYNGYAAGLDIKCGESGKYSYVTSWRENEIMLHVGPLMPLNTQDKQQVHRKRYIGNDIVCIIFMESDQQNIFDPSVIRSQFLHAFIIIHPEIIEEKRAWRVEIVYNKNMKEFGPSIPSPPLFFSEEKLREFLILKLVSAEISALQSDKFSIPNTKARQGILKSLVENGLATASRSQSSSPINSFLRSKSGSNENKLKGGYHQHQHPQRPMSAGPTERNPSRASMQSLRSALDSPPPPLLIPTNQHHHHHHHITPQKTNSTSTSSPSSSTSMTCNSSIFLSTATTRSLTPDQINPLPPPPLSSSPSLFPHPSKSSMLRDIKSFAKRRHSTTSSTNKSRATTPSSITDRSFHTESPYPTCHSPASYNGGSSNGNTSHLMMMESPISWVEKDDTYPFQQQQQHDTDRKLRRETSLSSISSTTSSLNIGMATTISNISSSSSISLNNHPSSSASLTMSTNSHSHLSSSPTSENGNTSIRSRAQHLMSTVMLGRRKQSISHHFNNNNNSNILNNNNNNNNNNNGDHYHRNNINNDGNSKTSRISKSKSILS